MDRHKPWEHKWPLSALKRAFMCFIYAFSYTESYNLDVGHSLNFTGPSGSLFGYSVLLHKHGADTWVLAGAPLANSSFDKSTSSPGRIFKCNITKATHCEEIDIGIMTDKKCGKYCHAETDNQWLGVSLSRQMPDGPVLACGHRWKNIYYSMLNQEYKMPQGVCYRLEADLITFKRFIPCYNDDVRKYVDDTGACQAGISSFLIENLIVMGAPGTSYWTGSLLVYDTSKNNLLTFLDENNEILFGGYLGYSVGAGHFRRPDSVELVGGAPQSGQTGKAHIFEITGDKLKIIFLARGTQLGAYFGATVCAVDLNSDGLSDLLVGAPMYSTVREEGRVHVYINRGNAKMEEAKFVLVGTQSYAARFGESITDLDDLDDDGYPDVAIGAPQEDDLRGAIYIYNGRKKGITQTFSQRITGTILGNPFKMFGQSVSGGIDIDGNDYPDVAVGAFLSDSVVVLRTRAVVIVEPFIFLPPNVNRSQLLCSENGQPAVCIDAVVCFMVQSRRISGRIALLYNLTTDVHHIESTSRFYFLGNETSNTTTGHVKTKPRELTCVTHKAFMRRDVRDIFTPIQFEMQYELGEHSVGEEVSQRFPALKPVLQQREEDSIGVVNRTEFARYCAWVNCSTNLQVFARLELPQSYNGMAYFALGEGKTIKLHVTLVNDGDDAFLTTLQVRFPSNLYFIKVEDAEEKHVSCELTEEDVDTMRLNCSVGYLFINSLAKHAVTFLLDVNQSSNPGDLHITLNTTCQSYENEDLLYDNFASVTLPLRYGAKLTVHGFVSPPTFMLENAAWAARFPEWDSSGAVNRDPEKQKNDDCFTEKFNFTYRVVNIGPSKALGVKAEMDIPETLTPYPYRLLNILDVQTSVGNCSIQNFNNELINDCDVPTPGYFEDVLFVFSNRTRRRMYCIDGDELCAHVTCHFGDLDIGTEATVWIEVELNPTVLQISPGRQPIMAIESVAGTSLREDPYILDLTQSPFATACLEGHYIQMKNRLVVLTASIVFGFAVLGGLIWCLQKCGFFKRSSLELFERRPSWTYEPTFCEVLEEDHFPDHEEF
ncbi:integrin alpha-4 [Megalops cyprinoides]|uniref:integrin alpha-4 n=1 Tax=Megalops cyprinoides TaxID=118141 RepID=UPI0018649E65|nr:integrin alpha-4 [Megalops cyprinoides]